MEVLRNSFGKTYYQATMTIDGETVAGVGLRQKGHGSRNPDKPSFKVKFGELGGPSTFLSLRGLGLKSNVTDASQIKQRLAMKVFERAGIASPRQASARVLVNGEDQGLYTVEEDVDKVFLKRAFRENDGNLYEVQGLPSYYFEDLGSDSGPYVPTHFEPKSPDRPDNSALLGLIQAINHAADDEFQAAVRAYLDWPQFLMQLAVETYVADYDAIAGVGGVNNFYLYQLKGTSRLLTIPKDKDLAFESPYMGLFDRFDQNVLLRRVMATPALRQMYLEALLKCVAVTGWSDGWFQQTVVAMAGEVRGDVMSDPLRRCNGVICQDADFEEWVGREVEFARGRSEFVLSELRVLQFQATEGAPQIAADGVVQASSGLAIVAPGEQLIVRGQYLAEQIATATEAQTVLGGVAVYVNGFASQMQAISSERLKAVSSTELTRGIAPVMVLRGGRVSVPVWVNIGDGQQ